MDYSLIERHLRHDYFNRQRNNKLKYVGLSPQAFFQLLPNLDVKKDD